MEKINLDVDGVGAVPVELSTDDLLRLFTYAFALGMLRIVEPEAIPTQFDALKSRGWNAVKWTGSVDGLDAVSNATVGAFFVELSNTLARRLYPLKRN